MRETSKMFSRIFNLISIIVLGTTLATGELRYVSKISVKDRMKNVQSYRIPDALIVAKDLSLSCY